MQKFEINIWSQNWFTNFRFEKNQWKLNEKIKCYNFSLLVKIIKPQKPRMVFIIENNLNLNLN